MGKFQTMYDVRLANKQHGHHFFDASSLRFFDSHIGHDLIHGRYFITSEHYHADYETRNTPGYVPASRLYTVRRVEDDGSISTMGTFQQFTSGAQARRYAVRLLTSASPCANCRHETYNPNYTCDDCRKGE